MSLDNADGRRSQPVGRRHVLVTGVSALAGLAAARAMTSSIANERDERAEKIVSDFRSAFSQIRHVGLITSPALVLPWVVTHVSALHRHAAAANSQHRPELLSLASRFAEYAGWMGQEAGDELAALWWTDRAVRFAAASGDDSMARYALVRQAEIALYRKNATATIELARCAQSDSSVSRRILGLAARCEAQGHALAGEHDACQRSLDRAATLLDAAAGESSSSASDLVLGSAGAPNQVSLASGWSLFDLGKPTEAARVLDREVPKILSTARRPRARFGVRRALAHAASGEVDHACLLAHDALLDAAYIDSATIRTDLRRLSGTLSRWRGHRAVRELTPSLMAALRTPTASQFR